MGEAVATDAEAPPARARRSPVQARSADTVRKINDATSRLLARGVAVDEMTTAQIAAEAEVSVGALYRFFADKQAVVDALAVRRIGEFQQALVQSLGARLAERDGPALVAFVIDAFVEFLDAHPDFVTIAFRGRHISRPTHELHAGADAGVTLLVKRFLTEGLGLVAPPDLDLRLRVASEVGDRLIGVAMEQADPAMRRAIIEQLKRIVGSYLFDAAP